MRKSSSIGLAGLLALSTVLFAFAGGAAAVPDGWSPPMQVEDDTPYNYNPFGVVSAVGHDGSILVAWGVYNPDIGYNTVGYTWYVPGVGWGAPSYRTGFLTDLDTPAVAAFPNGSFMLAWLDHDNGGWNGDAHVFTMVWTPADGWGTTQVASPGSVASDVSALQLGVDGNGNAFATWLSLEGPYWNLTANRYVAGSDWGATIARLENLDFHIPTIDLAVDRTGNAIVVWQQNDGSGQRAYANRYVVGSGWGTATLIDAGDLDVDSAVVAVDLQGNGIALMEQSNGTVNRIFANRFTVGSGWGSATPISVDNTYSAGNPNVAAFASGVFAATWTQYNGTETNLYGASYGTDWGPAGSISGAYGLGIAGPAFMVLGSGETMLLAYYKYNEAATLYHIQIDWWSETGGVTHTGQLDMAQSAAPSAAACNSNDECVVLWGQGNGLATYAWASIYMPPDVTAPSLGLDAPINAEATDDSTITVRGFTEPGARVVVNGIEAAVDGLGGYSVPLALFPGDNTVTVTSWDAAGNSATIAITVTYNDPVPGLESELAATQAELDTTQGQLTTTQGQLTTTQANLAAAQSGLAAANADITTLETDLAATKTAQTASDATQTTSIAAANGAAGTASLLGILGIVIGLAGIGMGFMMSRKAMGGAKPAEAKPAEWKPPEPPKVP